MFTHIHPLLTYIYVNPLKRAVQISWLCVNGTSATYKGFSCLLFSSPEACSRSSKNLSIHFQSSEAELSFWHPNCHHDVRVTRTETKSLPTYVENGR